MKKLLIALSIVSLSGIFCACDTPEVDISRYRRELDCFKDCIETMNTDPFDKNIIINCVTNYDTSEIDDENIIEPIEKSDSTDINNNLAESSPNLDTIDLDNDNNSKGTEDENTLDNNNEVQLDNNSIYGELLTQTQQYTYLMDKITSAILDTEDLISKIRSNEITLTNEQKIFLTEQINKLKLMNKKLSNANTKLLLSINELNNVEDFDKSMNYMIVLDNLLNNNELLEASFNSLAMMKQISNFYLPIPKGARGHMIYNYKDNVNPPIQRDFVINEDGDFEELSPKLEDNSTNEQDNPASATNSNYEPNIDTYYSNINPNIDTFFNTALLDNEFMYGRGGYGYNSMLPQYNMQNYDYNNQITPNKSEPNDNQNELNEDSFAPKKRRFNKNIDTYRNEKTPDIKTRLQSIRAKISKMFS